jgi:hypothetical protein
MLKCRGYWRTLLGLRGAVWYYSAEVPRKVADRPHLLTLLIGLTSPLLAVVALVISLQSLRTSETSLKVGQRAYLAVQNGELWVSRVPGAPAEVNVYLQCEVHNLGNTPAFIKEVKMAYGDMSGWTEVPPAIQLPVFSGEVGPKAIRHLTAAKLYSLDPSALRQLTMQETEVAKFRQAIRAGDTNAQLKYVRALANVGISLTYVDVFSQPQTIVWCYQEDVISPYPASCLGLPNNPLKKARLLK